MLELASQDNQDGELSWPGQRLRETVCYSRRRGKNVTVSEGLFLGPGCSIKDKSGIGFQPPRLIISNAHKPIYYSAFRVYSIDRSYIYCFRKSSVK
jgi:hypothetical protein